MNPPMSAEIMTGVWVLILGAFIYWWRAPARRLRRFAKARPCSVAEAPEGAFVRVEGTVVLKRDASVLDSPVHRTPCGAYHLVISRGSRRGSSVVVSESKSIDFIVRDATGEADVLGGDHVHLVDCAKAEGHSTLSDGLPPGLEPVLEARKIATHLPSQPYSFAYKECAIATGDRVLVAGRARWIEGDGGYRGREKRLVVEANESGELLVTNQPERFA